MADLRERLIAANLASETFIAEDGYPSTGINSNTEAADRAITAVVAWLREERCWSCDHWASSHADEGCWYTVSRAAVDTNTVCTCSVTRQDAAAGTVAEGLDHG